MVYLIATFGDLGDLVIRMDREVGIAHRPPVNVNGDFGTVGIHCRQNCGN